jgi:fructose-1,6-bisphosphatase
MNLTVFYYLKSVGNGVNGFTLDPSIGEFIMTHPKVKMHILYSSGHFGQFSNIKEMFLKSNLDCFTSSW